VAEQPPAHAVPEQVFGAQVTVWTAGHAPFPSQPAASVAVPPVQLADRQEVLAPGQAHVVRFVPSQLPPQLVPAPPQAACPVRGAPVTAVHVPLLVASPHDSQAPEHAALQQNPSAQKPLPHWLAAVHACPPFILHMPVASQLFVPLQLSASSALFTATHVPPPPVQAWQAPHEAIPQQCPSTQFPLVQSTAPAHVCPLAFLHVPVASHDDIPLHMSSTPDFTRLHVPSKPVKLHALHAVVHAVLQQ
jgi:hypothetical protein